VIKKIFLLLLVGVPLLAFNKTVTYEVSFSIFGTMAKVEMTKVIDKQNYVICIRAYTVGVVSGLTKGREETYISQGKIVDGAFLPDVFVKTRKTDDSEKVTVYRFDHDVKTVMKEHASSEITVTRKLDIKSLKTIRSTHEEYEVTPQSKELYARNDLISFIFNSPKNLSDVKCGEVAKFTAVAVKTDKSEIFLELPCSEEKIANVTQQMRDDETVFDILLKKKFFKGGEGKLVIALADDGFPSVAVMNDVVFFGDVVGSRSQE